MKAATMKAAWNLCLVLIVTTALPAVADVPQTVSYQGVLKLADGNPVPDGEYVLIFRIYDLFSGGQPLWLEEQTLPVEGGIFNAILGRLEPIGLPFDAPYWLGVQVGTDAELTPRTELTASPYARRAAVADVGEDADWVITGDDVSHESGVVRIGVAGLRAGGMEKPDAGDAGQGDAGARDQQGAKLEVFADEGRTVHSQLTEVNADADQRAAVLGYRTREVPNEGADYSFAGTNNGVTGANYWGDPHTFGVAGYCYNDFTRTGGVLGSDWWGDYWGALGYKDENSNTWGVYTPHDVFVGGAATLAGFRLASNPAAGHVLTSDAAGSGTWQPATGLSLPYSGTASSEGPAFHITQSGTGDVARFEVSGASGDPSAVYGKSTPADFHGIGGKFEGGFRAVEGLVVPTGSDFYAGVYGIVNGGSGTNYGIWGAAYGAGTNYAGFFAGDVHVTHNLSKGGGSFKIDHPLEPENRYLYHSFVESPDMKNVYDGVVVLDDRGEIWVELPEWFEALNRDFRYQLTPIGGPAPTLHVADTITGNRFRIAGGKPGQTISWQVTGIRQDPYAQMYPIQVEEEKRGAARGRYLHPEVYGQPEDRGEDYEHRQPSGERGR